MRKRNPEYRHQERKKPLPGLLIGAICLALFICHGCSKGADEDDAPSDTGRNSFTFFNIGADARFSDTLRDDLGDRLGPDSVARITILDLARHHAPAIETHFPDIFQLNQRLNTPPGERVEHDITKLMYRYSKKTDVPFDYVELVFSNANRRPLLFQITSINGGEGVVETLKKKYGPPETIEWNRDSARTLHWEKNGDRFLISIFKNRHGQIEYQFTIYFMENLATLAEKERLAREQRESRREKAGERAF